jgi:hypothetical protein
VASSSAPAWCPGETLGGSLSYSTLLLYLVVAKGAAMFGQLLPQPIDNTYRGSKLALWLFGLVVSLRILQSLMVIFNGYSTAINADGLPLDSYPPAAAQTVVALFALSSLWRLTFCSVCALVLARYRSAVPLMFVILTLNFLAAQLLSWFVPLARTGTPPGPYVNLAQFVLTAIGLVLSLRSRRVDGRRTHAA